MNEYTWRSINVTIDLGVIDTTYICTLGDYSLYIHRNMKDNRHVWAWRIGRQCDGKQYYDHVQSGYSEGLLSDAMQMCQTAYECLRVEPCEVKD